MADTLDPNVMSEAVAHNLSVDPDPTKRNEQQHADLAQIQETNLEAPPFPGVPLPGSFPDYDAFNPDSFAFPAAIDLPRTLVDDTIASGLEDRPFHDVFTQYPGLWEEVGGPAWPASIGQLYAILAASPVDTRLLYQGAGVLYGYTAYSVATNTSPFTAITDSLDGNGPALALIANNTVQSGYTQIGDKGIAFKNGLCLAGINNAQLALIPIIKRRHLIRHLPSA